MKRLFSIVVLCLIGLQGVLAQSREISGLVTSSDDGLSIPGASVVIKGTTIGTTTDFDGNYSIIVDGEGQILVFSFVGMKTIELPANSDSINLVMESESIGMDEVIVVAYGTVKKSSFTGSVSTVNGDKLKNTPVSSFEKALGGNVPGLQVSSVSGQPGASSEVRIRGIGSFSADQNPLYVIDGIPVTTTSTGETYSGEEGSTTSPLSTINPADIATITVLKDAAAASLYGSRAANGVIVITTKQGKSGKTKFNFSTSHGITDLAMDNFETVSGEDFVMLQREALENVTTEVDDYMDSYYPTPTDGKYTDWDDELMRKGQIHNYELSVSGGNEKTTFFASVSANQTDGVAKNSDMDRITGRVNLSHKATDKLTFTTNISFASKQQNIAVGGLYYANPFYASRQLLLPTDMVYNEDGSYVEESTFGYYNMVREYDLNERSSDTWRNTINSSVQYKILDGLAFKSTFSYDYIATDNLIYSSPISRAGINNSGEVYTSNNKSKILTSSNILTYDKMFNEQHHINILAGYEIEDRNRFNTSAEGYNVPEGITVNNGAAVPSSVGGYDEDTKMISYLGKVDYDFLSKYYLSASIRRDGSSRLGVDERWASFWSVSGSWRISQEDFISSKEWVNDLKFRASYGTNGTLPSGWFSSKALYSVDAYAGETALNYSQIENSDLSWEESKNLNIGLDFRIFDRYSGGFEYFIKKTDGMLLEVPLSRVTGFESMLQNVGSMQNKGWEFIFNADILKDSELTWDASFNISTYKNEITALSNGEEISDFPYIRREGEAYNSFYLRDWAGVDSSDGAAQWYVLDDDESRTKDDNGDYITTKSSSEAGKRIVGNADPDFTGGISNRFAYKGFTLDFLCSFSIGGELYNHAAYSMMSDGAAPTSNIMKSQMDRWQTAGDKSSNPKRLWNEGTSNYNSSRRLLDNDYLRLKSLTLGYNLPTDLIKKLSLSNVKIYVSGSNLLTLSSQDEVDVEQAVHGSTTWEIPTTKTYTFGVNIGF